MMTRDGWTRIGLWVVAGALLTAGSGLAAEVVRPRLKIEAHPSGTHIVGITPDDKLLITRGEGGAKMWDIGSGKERALPKLTGLVNSLSPDGKALALTDDRAVRLWSIASDKEAAAFPRDQPIGVPVFSPDGKSVATGWTTPGPKPGSRQGRAALWDVATGKRCREMTAGPGGLIGLAFSPDGKLLAAGTNDFPLIGDVTVWDAATGYVRATIRGNGVRCLAFAPDGKTLAVGFTANYSEGKRETRHVLLWDVAAAKDGHYLRHEDSLYSLAFSPDGKTLATGTDVGGVRLWDVARGKERAVLPPQPSYILSLAFTRDGRTLVCARQDGVVTCWDVPPLP